MYMQGWMDQKPVTEWKHPSDRYISITHTIINLRIWFMLVKKIVHSTGFFWLLSAQYFSNVNKYFKFESLQKEANIAEKLCSCS